MTFQSPRSGKFESNRIYLGWKLMDIVGFQSPKSGKFESNCSAKPKRAFE